MSSDFLVYEDQGHTFVHTWLPKAEVIEEYDETERLVSRRARSRDVATHESGAAWRWEVGGPAGALVGAQRDALAAMGFEAVSAPTVVRMDTPDVYMWQISPLEWPRENYTVTGSEDGTITIRTKNKKFYKKLELPELVNLDPSSVNWTWSHGLLVVRCPKPGHIAASEAQHAQQWRQAQRMTRDEYLAALIARI